MKIIDKQSVNHSYNSTLFILVLYFLRTIQRKLLSVVGDVTTYRFEIENHDAVSRMKIGEAPSMCIYSKKKAWVVRIAPSYIAVHVHLPVEGSQENEYYPSTHEHRFELRLMAEQELLDQIVHYIHSDQAAQEAQDDIAQCNSTKSVTDLPTAITSVGVITHVRNYITYVHHTDCFKTPESLDQYLLRWSAVIFQLVYDNNPGHIWCTPDKAPTRCRLSSISGLPDIPTTPEHTPVYRILI